MAVGLSTENARKWSRKGKSLQSKQLEVAEKGYKNGEQMAKQERVTSILPGLFAVKAGLLVDFLGGRVQIRDSVWPPRCGQDIG
jgi:hypothetical protein